MSIEKQLGQDCTGGLTHNFIVTDMDGSKLDFTFFQSCHEDDRHTLSIFTEVETEVGTLTPTFVICKDDVAELVKLLKEELGLKYV